MKTIYEFSTITAYWTGQSRQINDADGMPSFWTDEPLPSISDGMFARWNYPNWVVTNIEPPALPVPIEPIADQKPPNVIA